MKVKNIKFKETKLIFRDRTIEFDKEGFSEELTKEEATSLASLDLFEIVQENSKKEDKKDDKKSDKTTKDLKDKK